MIRIILLSILIISFLNLKQAKELANHCLKNDSNIEVVSGHFEQKYVPISAPDKTFDARKADFLNYQVKWGMVSIEGKKHDIGMCWVGGYFYTLKPWDASWAAHKMDGPTRNSAAINCAVNKITISGVHFFNVHDGIRTSNASDWIVQHNWGEYIRDDCVENDHLTSGRIFDSLFDGCYTGISTRPSKGNTSSKGNNNIVELDKVLLRLEAMPYPYKWKTKKGIIDEEGKIYKGLGVPYGHGSFFKITNPEINPHFIIKNSVFVADQFTEKSNYDFPPETLIDVCEDNIIIWLGPGKFPGKLPTKKFPESIRIVTGQAGRDLWQRKVRDWHARHPGVDLSRKQKSAGTIVFPKKF